ncbi:MAG: exosome non-catalytic core subunit rrp4 [Watsoniomyces obsoletus]|nr:MAG: exosome non-catalytic core subunit rrp4 [Watsoniomyces obsoletus]
MLALRSQSARAVRSLRLTSSSLVAHAAPRYPILRPRRLPSSLVRVRPFHVSAVRLQNAVGAAVNAEGNDAGEINTFRDLAEHGLVDDALASRITDDMNINQMTDVQRLTIPAGLEGTDLVAQAKTGTGKTLAFLVPVLQNILRQVPEAKDRMSSRRPTPSDVRAIIISPTRELAEQIAVEAMKVTNKTGIVVQTAVGGTQKRQSLYQMQRQGCHLLVGTPGRLKDLLSDPQSRVRAPALQSLVLDEADRLLDQGFWTAIQDIMELLPPREQVDRQTLMFSATIPEEVVSLVERTMKPNFEFVRTVQDGEQPTHERVPQRLVKMAGLENAMPTLLELCTRAKAEAPPDQPFKAIVFQSTTASVGLAATVFRNLRAPGTGIFSEHPLHPTKIIEMHSRLTQAERTRAAADFRAASSAILFSSDVAARGMDFPNVTHVIQLGMPQTREDYIHRLGRTARGNKTGEGWLLVSELQLKGARSRIRGLPLEPNNSLETASVRFDEPSMIPSSVARTMTQVREAAQVAPRAMKSKAYMSYLASDSYLEKEDMVRAINSMSKHAWGMEQPPSISPNLVGKLGLSHVPGVRVGREEEDGDRRGRLRALIVAGATHLKPFEVLIPVLEKAEVAVMLQEVIVSEAEVAREVTDLEVETTEEGEIEEVDMVVVEDEMVKALAGGEEGEPQEEVIQRVPTLFDPTLDKEDEFPTSIPNLHQSSSSFETFPSSRPFL